jgi:hypothetical protein
VASRGIIVKYDVNFNPYSIAYFVGLKKTPE